MLIMEVIHFDFASFTSPFWSSRLIVCLCLLFYRHRLHSSTTIRVHLTTFHTSIDAWRNAFSEFPFVHFMRSHIKSYAHFHACNVGYAQEKTNTVSAIRLLILLLLSMYRCVCTAILCICFHFMCVLRFALMPIISAVRFAVLT